MPTRTEVRGENRKKEAGANVDFSALWEVLSSDLLQDEGKGVYRYSGVGDSSTRPPVGQLRTLHRLDNDDRAPSSIELTILDTGGRCGITLGVCSRDYPSDVVPGTRETAVGLHTADEGTLLHFSYGPRTLGFTFTRGCVLKCSLAPDPLVPAEKEEEDAGSLIEFWKDGERIGVVSVRVPEGGLYGVIAMSGPGERVLVSPPVLVERTEFDQIWEVSSPHIRHERLGLCHYVGPGYVSEESIGTVRTKQRLDPFGPLHFRSFEIRIVNRGEKNFIAVGICCRAYPHNMFPGWQETSVGYHADNGYIFDNSENGEETGYACKVGDTMRCTVQPTTDRSQKQVSVVFHRNGHVVGKRVAWIPDEGFYGVFGMMSKRECVQLLLPVTERLYTPPKADFLSVWEAVTPHLQYREDGVFAYVGEGGADAVGSIRSKRPLNPVTPSNTFEVKIVDPGERCYIALGVCTPEFLTTQLPGWGENSVGFHADNSFILNGSGNEQLETRCHCTKGDVIRCTLEPVDGSQKQLNVVYHRNGILIGKAMLWNSKEGFHGQVGCMSRGEVVQIASPQTTPSSLSYPIAPRSMSVPAVQASSVVPKNWKQMSTQDYSHMTPAIREGDGREPFSEPMHRVQTAPVLKSRHEMQLVPKAPVHSRAEPEKQYHYQHQYREKPVTEQFPFKSQPPHQHETAMYSQAHSKPRQPEKQVSLASFPKQNHPLHVDVHRSPPAQHHSERSVPHTQRSPFEHATTASPFPLKPADGHPLGRSGLRTHSESREVEEERSSSAYYASQVSTASAASDADLHSMLSYESQRQRTSSGTYNYQTPPKSPLNFRSQTQSHRHGGTRQRSSTTLPPTTTSPAKKLSSDNPSFHKTSPQSAENASKLGFEDYDSPPLKQSAKHKVLQDQYEPESKMEVGATPGPQVFTKKENVYCRIIHNASCSEDGSILHCTLPEHSPEPCLIVRQLQLTEKMPYFEVEIVKLKSNDENLVVGVVPRDHTYTSPLGCESCSAAYSTANGSLLAAGEEAKCKLSKPCSASDVIGCKVEWTYKLESYDRKQDSRVVGIEWFLNGCSIAKRAIGIPSLGFYPAVTMLHGGTVVRVRHIIGLNPESYFISHPLPEGFKNIDVTDKITEPWNCFQNSEVDENNYLTHLHLDRLSSLPAIAQSHTPFTTAHPYFEVELQHPIADYSTLSIGALEGESEECIPGEAPNSIAIFPKLRIIMCNGRISTMALPVSMEEEMDISIEKLTIGIGVDFHSIVPQHQQTGSRRVVVFFTMNHQLLNSTYLTLPSTSLHPTVAVGSDKLDTKTRLLKLNFSDPWPQAASLPLGFARSPPGAFKVNRLRSTVAENHLPKGINAAQALQAAMPISHSHTYFEMKILECSESHIFSCGLAPHNFPLTSHPGDHKDSIGLLSHDGSLHHFGQGTTILSSPFNYKGATIGCGARFPTDGTSKYVEVFFTLNGTMVVRRMIENREPGLFPTVGFYTQGAGVAHVDLYAKDPFPGLKFSSTWRELKNFKNEGAFLRPMSFTEACVAQLSESVPHDRPLYFTISTTANTSARMVVGMTNSLTCPLLFDKSTDTEESSDPKGKSTTAIVSGDMVGGVLVNLTNGQVTVQGSNTLHKIAHFQFESTEVYGFGVQPIEDSKHHLFFVTCKYQVIFCKSFLLDETTALFPTIFMRAKCGQICVDACTLWPLQTVIGRGWARVNHLLLKDSKITHGGTRNKCSKTPVGFAQASMPLTPSSSYYFEIEVCSRSKEKAIAIGLAPRNYQNNTWVGWKPSSIAYHFDDGRLFTGDGFKGHKIGPQIYDGQVVGCGINSRKPVTGDRSEKDVKVDVFFTVNGALIVEQRISVPPGGLYPTICLESPSESVHFQCYPHFPPVRHLVGADWANCYSIHQAGLLLEHSFQHREILAKGIPRGFCQASCPFSPTRSYFEIKIVQASPACVIQMGVAVKIPVGCRSPSTDSVMFYSNGQVLLRSDGGKSTMNVEKCVVGDVVGCGIVFTDNEPSTVQFYLNNLSVLTVPLPGNWKNQPLFPTIVLYSLGTAVLPRLNLPPPEWDRSSLIGWLRTERVQVKGNIATYIPSNTGKKTDVGLCQLSMCLEKELNSSFEVEILDRGESCTIAVGAACTSYPSVSQLGWKENSVAYHGDDGKLFHDDPLGITFGPSWKPRDIIGVGVREPSYQNPKGAPDMQVYFVKNGVELGHTTLVIPPGGLFPTIGFYSPGEKVKITLHSAPHGLGNFNPALLKWRDMCGLKLKSTSVDNQFAVEYIENGRKNPYTEVKPAVAVYGEPFSEKLQYYEVDLLSLEAGSTVAIGVVPNNYSLEMAPGWGKQSIGYHSDNGMLYQAQDRGKFFGPVAKKGDVIGCGISFTPNNQLQCCIFFTFNGVEIGRVRTTIPATGLFPCVCLIQQHDKVRVTFSETFKPKISSPELHMVGLMRINNCSYADQIVQYSGASSQGSTSPGFAQFSLPMLQDHNHFTVHILKADDTVMIGLAVRDYPLKYLPGAMSISVAYDITKGIIKAVYGADNFHTFNNVQWICLTGDRVGCGLVCSDSKSKPAYVYFTKNGVVVKRMNLNELFEDLYPVVGFAAEKKGSLLFMDWRRPDFEFPNLLNDT